MSQEEEYYSPEEQERLISEIGTHYYYNGDAALAIRHFLNYAPVAGHDKNGRAVLLVFAPEPKERG